jgi:hypothetical protein
MSIKTETNDTKDKKSILVSVVASLLGIVFVQGEILVQYVSIAWVSLVPSIVISGMLNLIQIQYGLQDIPSFLIVWMVVTSFIGLRK